MDKFQSENFVDFAFVFVVQFSFVYTRFLLYFERFSILGFKEMNLALRKVARDVSVRKTSLLESKKSHYLRSKVLYMVLFSFQSRLRDENGKIGIFYA